MPPTQEKPTFGICLGMQLLSFGSEEDPVVARAFAHGVSNELPPLHIQ